MPETPYDERDEDTQRFTPTWADEQFVDAVRDCVEDGDLATAARVADHVGCAKRTAIYRLNKLVDKEIVKQDHAGQTAVWRIVDED